MAANFVSGGANIAFWDEQSLSKNPNLQNCDPPDALKCNSHWNSLAFSPNNEMLACAESRGGDVRILNLVQEQKRVELSMSLHKDGASYTCCEYMPSKQRYVFSGGRGGELSLWDLKFGNIAKSYTGHSSSSSVTSIGSHHSFSHIVSGSSNGTILLHSYSTSHPQKVLSEPADSSGGKEAINHLVLSPYERGMVASCSANGSVSFWSAESQRQLAHFPGAHTGAASRLCFSPYNRMLLASCGTDGNFVFYDIVQRKMLSKSKLSCPLFSVCLLNDGTTMVGGGADGQLHVFDLRNCATPRDTLPAHTSPVYCLVLQTSSASRHRKSTTRIPLSSSKELHSTSTPAPPGKESTSVKVRGGGKVSQSPPTGGGHFTPVGRDSAAVGGSAVGGDSLFSPLATGASPSESGRVSDQSDTSSRKTRSLPQRPGGIGLERQPPTPHTKDHSSPRENPPFSTTFDLFTSTETRENVEGSPGRAQGKQALHSTAITAGGSTIANKLLSGSTTLSPVHTAVSTNTVLSADTPGSPTRIPHPGGPSLTPPTSRAAGVPPSTSETSLSRPVHRGDHLDGEVEKKAPSSATPAPTGDLLSVAPAPVDGGMSPVILKFIQAMVDESTEDLRMSFNRELMHLYTDILRQLSLQEKKSESAFSKLESLVAENRRLQEQNKKLLEENKRLKTLY